MKVSIKINLLITVFLVSACGGGGGGGSSSTEPNTPGPVTNVSINSFIASSYSIQQSESITLSWSSSNATSCSGSGDWSKSSLAAIGTEIISFDNVGSYSLTLTCVGSNSSSDSKTINIEVSANNSANVSINSFVASSYNVQQSESITLSWSSSNATSCSGSGDWTEASLATNDSDTILFADVGSYSLTLTCVGSNSSSDSKTINIEVSANNSTGNIYDQVKESYCAIPNDDRSTYWIDNFNSPVINSENYSFQTGNGFTSQGQWINGWGNNENQYYTSCSVDSNGTQYSQECNSVNNSTENAFIENGYLKIQPLYLPTNKLKDPYCIGLEINENTTCQERENGWDGLWQFTSARITTQSKVVLSPNSEVTVCFKLPKGMNNGFWPAIWMLPQPSIVGSNYISIDKSWPRDGELDIMEHMRNHNEHEIQSSLHYGNSSPSRYKYAIESVPMNVNFAESFHSITLKWETDKISFYLDTQTQPYVVWDKNNLSDFNTYYWPFNENFHLIFNVAVGGDNGGQPDINSTTKTSNTFCTDKDCSNHNIPDEHRMLIDYIEVKSLN